MPEPPLPSFFFLQLRFKASAKTTFFFLTSFSCSMKWDVGVPQAAVPVGNMDVAGT